jgi:iron complex transport system substrate-binding protein
MASPRFLRITAVAVVGALALAACGSGDDDAAGDDPAAEPSSDAFPVTIEHKYGETVIEDAPERVVTVGLTEQDALLALGIVPVATTEWFGEHPGAIWPWAQDELEALDGEAPESLGDATEINFEKVAAQDPDLILAMYAEVSDEDYARLTEIAPTIASPEEFLDYGIPWEEATRIVGQAVGKGDEAEALIDDIEADFAEAVAAHPEFAGKVGLVATPYEGIYVYGPQDPRSRFLIDLGFTIPEGLDEITGEEFGGTLSEERADLLDVDAIVWLDAQETEGYGGPLYETFAVHTEAREVFLDSFGTTLGGATSFVSVLSLPYLLEGLVPMLAAAVDGDPATVPPAVTE